jgi:hypothetical protein
MAKRYGAKEVTFSVGGKPITGGAADGEFLTIEETQARVTKVVGSQGEVVISPTNDPTGAITCTLLQTADGNDVFDEMAENTRRTGVVDVRPFMVRDRNGRGIHEGSLWVEEVPSVSFDRGATSRAWKLGVEFTQNRIRGTAA